ncbi:MAG: HlyD family efflux transporter periplasmic adaptor subunit [Bacteroidota bacterium]|nr:hypothetical protein [Odoribacter sp.]MDP3641869.1 HlyD family efflux transporter periplasmic adaptor subunit [Bacteroidota bacterium]
MEKDKKPIEIELRSDEFQEIVQQSPRWMIRSGITLIFGFLVLLLAGSWFFRYPDIIEAKIIISKNSIKEQIELLSSPKQQSVSENQSPITGRIILSLKDSRKVANGQKVNIRFDDYPSMEYGLITGRVKSISLSPDNGNYLIEVELPTDLKTNYNIPLKFDQEMMGSAEIITEDLRLIQRFINPVKSLLKHRISSAN